MIGKIGIRYKLMTVCAFYWQAILFYNLVAEAEFCELQ